MSQAESLRRKIRARLAEQRALVSRLLRLREQLRGSLFVRYGQCGKEGCACRSGRRHGPYYVVSTRSAGRGGFTYVEAGRFDEARDLVERYRRFRKGLREFNRANLELVRLLRRYQNSMAKTGGRSLGLQAQL
jgi:hypothetical protein